jgi:hypothetical protein
VEAFVSELFSAFGTIEMLYMIAFAHSIDTSVRNWTVAIRASRRVKVVVISFTVSFAGALKWKLKTDEIDAYLKEVFVSNFLIA